MQRHLPLLSVLFYPKNHSVPFLSAILNYSIKCEKNRCIYLGMLCIVLFCCVRKIVFIKAVLQYWFYFSFGFTLYRATVHP